MPINLWSPTPQIYYGQFRIWTATVQQPENHRGLSNNVRQEGNLENVHQEGGGFPSQLTPDILICFHNFLCYGLLGLANMSLLTICITRVQREMCLLENIKTSEKDFGQQSKSCSYFCAMIF